MIDTEDRRVLRRNKAGQESQGKRDCNGDSTHFCLAARTAREGKVRRSLGAGMLRAQVRGTGIVPRRIRRMIASRCGAGHDARRHSR